VQALTGEKRGGERRGEDRRGGERTVETRRREYRVLALAFPLVACIHFKQGNRNVQNPNYEINNGANECFGRKFGTFGKDW
jgi:hypothetical protein